MEIAAVMLVGAVVGRSGRFMLDGLRGDGIIATMVGILGAMLAAFFARGAGLNEGLPALILVSAVGSMAFFALYRATVGSLRSGAGRG